MSAVLDQHGNALVFDTETGDVHTWAVPTALENVERGQGRYVHGATGVRRAPAKPAKVKTDEPVIELKEEELLDLPQADVEQAAPEAAVEAPADDTPRPRPRPRSKAPRRPKK
jgi:hypothetical protein